ncbi:hypothetical protein BKA65DRAFT_586742 [Rhexocercosporidium sp. MPI-PUGE-AT-0058]|nr:hypothetical protein BKA65DRAFT_586742 [Rhexocercosporidium sp. MPI-PUGE-AT-0058]
MPPSSSIVKLPFSASLNKRWGQWLASKQPHPVQSAASSGSDPVSPQSAPVLKLRDHFSESQLALAFAIVKDAPEGMSTAEFCQQLQKKIKDGKPVPPEMYRYVDGKQHWKDMCDKIFEEKVVLETKVRCLEEAQRILKEKLRTNHRLPQDDQWDSGSEDVREGGEIARPVDTEISRKRPATSQDVLEDRLGDISRIDDDIYLILSSRALQIIDVRSQLERATKQLRTLSEINTLARYINQTLILLEKAIPDCCLPLKALKTNSNDSKTLSLLKQVLLQVAYSFHACFNAMNQLFSTIPGRLMQAEIVNRMVMFFKNSLNFLETICALQSEDEQNQRKQSTRNKRPRLEGTEYAVNKYLAQTLALIAKEVDWKVNETSHRDILEGMLFFIIDHTGRLISESIFGEHVAASDNAANISNSPTTPASGLLRPESRYMVQVLYAALGGADRKALISQAISAGHGDQNIISHGSIATQSGSTTRGETLRKAKKKLQGALRQSILGEIDPESLKLPEIPIEMNEVEDTRVGVERYGKEWLLETVWGLIGWDMVT